MGYYTDFTISITKKKESRTSITEVAKAFEESLGCPFMTVYDDNDDNDEDYACGDYQAKWYNFDKDLRKIAEYYPEFLIEIDRKGEDYDDWTATRVYGGKIETRQVIVKSPWDQF